VSPAGVILGKRASYTREAGLGDLSKPDLALILQDLGVELRELRYSGGKGRWTLTREAMIDWIVSLTTMPGSFRP
jgi:hypothetical protein